MYESTANARTRDAIRQGHLERSDAFLQGLRWIFKR